ncbi:MAG: ATP-binding protein [Sulfurimonas sp.]|nr:ATP-binding protein [Sulfurimonas sp.]
MIDEFNSLLADFCLSNKINTLVFDNYTPDFNFPNISQLIISSQIHYEIDFLITLKLFPLDYEEFLAYEHKYDSSALNHFFQLGGFAAMHKINSDERYTYIQKSLKSTLDTQEFEILKLCAKMMAQKLSPFSIYERLKQTHKISKDKLYRCYENLQNKNYIHLVQKINHPKATKKIYLCDISLRLALTSEKNFARLFENMVYLELKKSNKTVYYDDAIDFYLPYTNEIILCVPFADERTLFKKVEAIEAFIFTNNVKTISVITMNNEGGISHPLSKIEMMPFDIWALGD